MSRVEIKTALGLILVLLVAACARPVGDFGRPANTLSADVIAPAIGEISRAVDGRARSSLVMTDEEKRMRDRIWRFLVAPQINDWQFNAGVELRRTGILGSMPDFGDTARYYTFLSRRNYRASSTIYAAIAGDIEADIAMAPKAFDAICAVQVLEERRRIATSELFANDMDAARALGGRQAQNASQINWFVASMTYRADSYGAALDRVLVNAPHPNARIVDDGLNRLAPFVERARRGEFCPA
ncbi:MAG: hypothetical protein GXP01_11180 [Alphaproteobacteria bacterium]|nr:hypothetical protein [Alphaproteobacteria bacterium]